MPYAYHQPSFARISEGSAKVSAKEPDTGLAYELRVTGGTGLAAGAPLDAAAPAPAVATTPGQVGAGGSAAEAEPDPAVASPTMVMSPATAVVRRLIEPASRSAPPAVAASRAWDEYPSLYARSAGGATGRTLRRRQTAEAGTTRPGW